MRLFILGLFAVAALCQDRIVVEASTLLDGKGAILRNQHIVIEGGRIVSVGPGSGRADYNLSGLTVMPGWIDTHIHLHWHMDANHKSVSGGVKPEEMALYTAADAWLTLQGGFTTVQSVGSPFDGPVRDRINEGVIPGPRVLTSLIQIQGSGGGRGQQHAWTVDELREMVRKDKADGADVIKLFATTGLGAGGGPEHDGSADSGGVLRSESSWFAVCSPRDRGCGRAGRPYWRAARLSSTALSSPTRHST